MYGAMIEVYKQYFFSVCIVWRLSEAATGEDLEEQGDGESWWRLGTSGRVPQET